jgi:Rnl2 family RNA ligase
MKFLSYRSSENSYQQKFVEKVKENLNWKSIEWVVQEKIHGANFSFYVNEETIRCASRNNFLGNQNFHGYLRIKQKYEKDIKSLFDYYKKVDDDIQYIVVYGELFGGSYPHPDVPRENIPSVQKGVFYLPYVDFLVFDILLVKENSKMFVSPSHMIKTLKTVGVNLSPVPTLSSNFLDFCLDFPIENIHPAISKVSGLPQIENNIIEGIIIRPDIMLNYDSIVFPVFKKKNGSFIEKTSRGVKEHTKLLENVKSVLDNFLTFVNSNRLDNVLSKFDVSELTNKDI